MANYLLCNKEFKSLGHSYIELADININKISVQFDENRREDRTDFLKYGNCYNTTQKSNNFINEQLQEQIEIHQDELGLYFDYSGNNILTNDVMSLYDSISNNYIYICIKNIIGTKYYIYNETDQDIINIEYSNVVKFRYDAIKDCVSLYEIFIEQNPITNIPLFMPDLSQISSSSEIKIIIHVKKNINDFNVIITSTKNYINGLNSNNKFVVYHNKCDEDNDYISYVICLLFNGNNSWFVI